MAVKTTKIQCNQDVDLRGKADIEGKVTCGNDVEVDGKLTINSAKDLKTKDGSSIGGSDTSPWKVIPAYKMWGFENTNDGTNTYYGISGDSFIYIAENTSQDNPIDFQVGFIPLGGITPGIGIYSFTDNISGITSKITVPDDFITRSQDINLGDINKKQATLYRHTVTFLEDGLGYANRFTAYSEKNTPINSIQDLITVFGNTKLQCLGTVEQGSRPCIGIDIGPTADTIFFVDITDTQVKLYTWYMTQPDATLTITDDVTAM